MTYVILCSEGVRALIKTVCKRWMNARSKSSNNNNNNNNKKKSAQESTIRWICSSSIHI